MRLKAWVWLKRGKVSLNLIFCACVWEAVVHSAFVLMEMYSWGNKNDQKKLILKDIQNGVHCNQKYFLLSINLLNMLSNDLEIKNVHHIFLKGSQIACLSEK